MALKQQLTVAPKQTQALRLNTHMLQSLEILTLPVFELQQRIQQELESNPALERVPDHQEISIEDTLEQFDDWESAPEESEWMETDFINGANELGAVIERVAVSQQHQNLHNSLIEQLRLQKIDDTEYQYGCTIINNLDENGFHIINPHAHPALPHSATVEKMIALIQTFEPWGICVEDVRESLILQARLHKNAPKHTETILKDFFVQLEKRKFSEIVASAKITTEEVERVYRYIRSLTPYPGKTIHAHQTQFIIPDLEIRFTKNNYKIAINEQAYPKLRINKLFLNINAAESEHDSEFIRSYRQQAQSFMATLKRRNHTLLRTAYALLHKQHRFFRLGPQHLQPLRLKDVAVMLNVHETTVSRIASQKYIQTDWGIYPISYLFSSGIDSPTSGVSRSKEGIKAIIKNMLLEQREAGDNLSDRQITDQLQKKGIHIARRTVTKYRNELQIPNTTYRYMQTNRQDRRP